jgi:hydrogenase maturation protease
MNRPRLLIAGIGNIFFGDDAFGVEVAQRLARRQLPEEVRVVDFGIRGLDLTYALLDGYEIVILVDALPRGGTPGTLYVLEPECGDNAEGENGGMAMEGHNLDPVKVLRLAAAMGAKVQRLLLVGCEPTPPPEDEDMRDGLSAPVQLAVDEAIDLVEALATRLLRRRTGSVSCGVEHPVANAAGSPLQGEAKSDSLHS